jgi:hypothetical protein
MKKPLVLLALPAVLLSVCAAVLFFHSVSAHQIVTIGSYQVEIGWLDEPPVVGERNAIILNVAPAGANSTSATTSSAAPSEPVDISGLKVEVLYGGESKMLSLQPLSEDSQGQYLAPILPTRPGKYTVRLSGALGTPPASAEVQPEEVQTADVLQFPRAAGPDEPSGASALPVWLSGAALLVGLAALGLAAFNLTRKR